MGGHVILVVMLSPPKFNVVFCYMLFFSRCQAWRKGTSKKVVNEWSQWVKDMKRHGQKEHSRQGDKQNKFISITKHTLIHKKYSCVCVTNTTKLQKGLMMKKSYKLDYVFKMSISFYGLKQSVSLRLEKVL